MKRLLLSFSVILALTACSDGAGNAPDTIEAAPVDIFMGTARLEQIVDPILATGEVQADKQTQIKARVDGIIETIHVDVGDAVVAGQPLFMTRQADYANRLAEAENGLNLAKAELAQASAALKRSQSLVTRGHISQARMDEVRAQHAVAQARMGIAEAAQAQAQQDLDDTEVTAPYDGVITRRMVDEGTMMYALTGNTAVVELVKADVVRVVAHLPSTHLSRIREGSRARINVDGLANPIESQVRVVNDKVDTKTRSIEIRLLLDNADGLLKPGLFVKVTVFPDAREALVVDRGAVQGLAGDSYVYVPAGDLAKRRTVTLRDVDAARVEILDGLQVGEAVLQGPNLPDIKDGVTIRVLGNTHGQIKS